METIGRDRIGGAKYPIGEDRLHDLKAVRDPLNAAEKSMGVHAGVRRGRQSEHDLRLDARLNQTAQRSADALLRQVVDCSVVHISPYRRVNLVFGPDCPVSKTDLAPNRPLSAGLTPSPNVGGDPISVLETEIRI